MTVKHGQIDFLKFLPSSPLFLKQTFYFFTVIIYANACKSRSDQSYLGTDH